MAEIGSCSPGPLSFELGTRGPPFPFGDDERGRVVHPLLCFGKISAASRCYLNSRFLVPSQSGEKLETLGDAGTDNAGAAGTGLEGLRARCEPLGGPRKALPTTRAPMRRPGGHDQGWAAWTAGNAPPPPFQSPELPLLEGAVLISRLTLHATDKSGHLGASVHHMPSGGTSGCGPAAERTSLAVGTDKNCLTAPNFALPGLKRGSTGCGRPPALACAPAFGKDPPRR